MTGSTWAFPPDAVPRMEGIQSRIDTEIKKAILREELRVQTLLKTKYLSGDPIKRRTGNLSRSLHIDPTSISQFTGYQGSVFFGEEAPYAYGLEVGNPPHVIRAKKAKSLHFFAGGEELFRHEVDHPGNPPFLFVQHALDETAEQFFKEIGDGVSRAISLKEESTP